MKSLGELLSHVTIPIVTYGALDKSVNGFQFDSRKLEKGIAFIAKKGTFLDGHDYIDSAINAGAEIIICEKVPNFIQKPITYIQCDAIPEFLSQILPAFNELQLNEFIITGVTGTNGKTSVASLLYDLFSKLGYRCGLISTIEIKIGGDNAESTHTTPDQISLYTILAEMQRKHCAHVFMEVSSHALDQKRVEGLPFKAAIFTNITHDHLDYHKTFKAYLTAKKSFFDKLGKDAIAITNADDRNGRVMIQNTKANVITYAVRNMADHRGRIIENSLNGLHLKFDDMEWHSRMIGDFNVYNLLAVYTCAIELGIEEQLLLETMSLLTAPEGRFDWIKNQSNGKMGIVDYAHTPDALEKIIYTIREIKNPKQQIISVIGCGGNRDKAKRPVMAGIASRLSERLILTSDNPRDEDPMEILSEMERGISAEKKDHYLLIVDRAQAIKTACMMAGPSDIILVAGKGHEKYQEIKGQKLPFDDMKILKQFLLN